MDAQCDEFSLVSDPSGRNGIRGGARQEPTEVRDGKISWHQLESTRQLLGRR